jgi:hypothetical protein
MHIFYFFQFLLYLAESQFLFFVLKIALENIIILPIQGIWITSNKIVCKVPFGGLFLKRTTITIFSELLFTVS